MMISIFHPDHVWVSEGFLVQVYTVDRFKALPLEERNRIWTVRSATANDAELIATYGDCRMLTQEEQYSGEVGLTHFRAFVAEWGKTAS